MSISLHLNKNTDRLSPPVRKGEREQFRVLVTPSATQWGRTRWGRTQKRIRKTLSSAKVAQVVVLYYSLDLPASGQGAPNWDYEHIYLRRDGPFKTSLVSAGGRVHTQKETWFLLIALQVLVFSHTRLPAPILVLTFGSCCVSWI